MSSPTPHEPSVDQDVKDNTVHGDQNVAGRDNNITTYSGLRHLRPRRVNPDALMPVNRFVAPDKFDTARQEIRPFLRDTDSVRIVVLVAPEAHGRKSAALRLLTTSDVPRDRIFELLPDWDDPDVACLPREHRAGYHLNLRGVTQPLPDEFYRELVTYADELRKAGSCMVITATDSVWTQEDADGPHSGITRVEVSRPKASEVVKKYLDGSAGTRERSGWINDPESVFCGLLPEGSAPREAVRLASLIAKAKDAKDEERLDEYHGWKSHLNRWFSDGGPNEVEKRAIRIAGAFLDKAPASVVLDSADILLAAPEMNWSIRKGGLLALPDAQKRLEPVDMSFDETTGVASLIHESQGPAVLHRVWTKHTQLTAVLTRWLQEISQGPASEHLQVLASSLTRLAEMVGVTPIFSLAEGWLRNNGERHLELVGDLLSDLATHPTLGSRARAELKKWAWGTTQPLRQRAVARACAGSFGKTYPSQALTRARYILNSGSEKARQEAIDAVRYLAILPDAAPVVADTVVTWITNSGKSTGTGRYVFFEIFGAPSVADRPETSPLEVALAQSGELGEAICRRLLKGWQHIIQQGEDTAETTRALLSWRRGAEDGRLPQTPVVDTIIALGRATGIVNPPIRDVVNEEGPLQSALITALFAVVEGTYGPASNSITDTTETAREEQEPQGLTEADSRTQ